MKRMRIELARERGAAEHQAAVLGNLGFAVDPPQSAEIVWVTDAANPQGLPLVTYTDPADQQVWVVIGRK